MQRAFNEEFVQNALSRRYVMHPDVRYAFCKIQDAWLARYARPLREGWLRSLEIALRMERVRMSSHAGTATTLDLIYQHLVAKDYIRACWLRSRYFHAIFNGKRRHIGVNMFRWFYSVDFMFRMVQMHAQLSTAKLPYPLIDGAPLAHVRAVQRTHRLAAMAAANTLEVLYYRGELMMRSRYYKRRGSAHAQFPAHEMKDEDRRFDPTRRSGMENDPNNPRLYAFYPIAKASVDAYNAIRKKLLNSPYRDKAAACVNIADILSSSVRSLACTSMESLFMARAMYSEKEYMGLASPVAESPPLTYSKYDQEKPLNPDSEAAETFRQLGIQWHELTFNCRKSRHIQSIARIRLDREIDAVLGNVNLSVSDQRDALMSIKERIQNRFEPSQ